MLLEDTVAVYCKEHTEQTDIFWGQNADRTSQEAHHVSATESNRLIEI
jgi:hypothetical protein